MHLGRRLFRQNAPICNRYETPEEWEVERFWHIGRTTNCACRAKCFLVHRSVHPERAGSLRLRAHSGQLRRSKLGERENKWWQFRRAEQDKRSLIAIKLGDVDQWLARTMDVERQIMRLMPVEVFGAEPMIALG
ncbi:hypothetical protein [Variovorax ginsengisoli]|uniref:Uncharacterized protein n=1 Tax=Variovorax ginsengisoli TaxID=363844 RepID=A0ABT8SJX2_9BURK|nr:hypothetical protein [Variovorax ginsengisoli]MDN8618691.1 hypothetical protein [Variovorax ginsengisoli]MDO1537861.1 hypothetical protein [Variovorax ginsengisoli]